MLSTSLCADEELEDVEYSPESTQEEGAVCTTNAAIKRVRWQPAIPGFVLSGYRAC